MADTGTPEGSTHDLLLALAGRVDDDLLAWARELVAVGEDGHALDLLLAGLVADRVALPAALRAALVDAARSWRTELDADRTLPAALTVDAFVPEHQFDPAGAATDRIDAALADLPARQIADCHLWLTWRLTPAGTAPGPLPHPVLLVEVDPDTRAADVLAYQLAAALDRAGVRASVEAFTGGATLPVYHRAALRTARWITPAGDAPVSVGEPSPVTARLAVTSHAAIPPRADPGAGSSSIAPAVSSAVSAVAAEVSYHPSSPGPASPAAVRAAARTAASPGTADSAGSDALTADALTADALTADAGTAVPRAAEIPATATVAAPRPAVRSGRRARPEPEPSGDAAEMAPTTEVDVPIHAAVRAEVASRDTTPDQPTRPTTAASRRVVLTPVAATPIPVRRRTGSVPVASTTASTSGRRAARPQRVSPIRPVPAVEPESTASRPLTSAPSPAPRTPPGPLPQTPAWAALNDPLLGPLREPLLAPLLDPTIRPEDPLGLGPVPQSGPDETGPTADSWNQEWLSGEWTMHRDTLADLTGLAPPRATASHRAETPAVPAGEIPTAGTFTAGTPDAGTPAGVEVPSAERPRPVPTPGGRGYAARHRSDAGPGEEKPRIRPEPLARLAGNEQELLAQLHAELAERERRPRAGRRGTAPNGATNGSVHASTHGGGADSTRLDPPDRAG